MLRPRLALAATMATFVVVGPILTQVTHAADEIVVRPGDTLTAISRRHGVPIVEIVELNAIADPSRIYAGQRLRLAPPSDDPDGPAGDGSAGVPPSAVAPDPLVHTVGYGQHLTGIARHYGTTIAAIVAANGLADPSRIYVGQVLAIPVPAPAAGASTGTTVSDRPSERESENPASSAASPPAGRQHTVQAGEHLTGIARQYGTTIAAIVAANGLADPSRIYAGQRLTIPTEQSAATAPTESGRPMPASMAKLVAKRGDVRNVIIEEAKRFGVPPAFALAVAWQESGWQQDVVSSAGAIGVMQLLPATAEWIGQGMLGAPVDADDLRQNVRAGVRLLAHYLDRYGGDKALVLAAYYQGQTAADRHGVYPVTKPYISSITVLEELFGG